MSTIRVSDTVPSPTEDSHTLKEAFQGFGTDEKAIIKVLGARTARQRREIRDTYQQLYNENLIDALFSELSGDFRKAVILWTIDPPERDAKLANEALQKKKIGIKNLKVIVEIACASSPHHLMAVRQAYSSLFDCSLEEDIVSAVPPLIAKVLVALVRSYRYDKELVDPNVANSEAVLLHEAIQKKKLDLDHVLYILGTRNFYQLRETFKSYKEKFKNPVEKDIKNCGNGDLESLLRMVVSCIDCPEKHFAEVIGTSVIGFGTDEDSLTRAIVSRAEIDMMKIRGEYFNLYKTNLDGAVIDDTSGDYRDFLMTLLGARI
ncbi:annexin D3 [Carica papaya]|uniref:annexin D3 n=1 Tax=Carica papaya TaxID=3649 RepID=UPI000B8C7604|nr:annexin D3 [Carica papaya]